MQHFPILAIMILFLGAFLVALVGKSKILRNIVVGITMLISTGLVIALFKPVMLNGEIITYWMGNWSAVSGYAIGIAIEVDQLGLFFGLVVSIAITLAGFYSFVYMKQDDSTSNFYVLFLMLGGGVLGFVFSGDLFNMYVMIEIMIITAVALTAFRSWKNGAREAAFKYLAVGTIGSASMLLGTILIYSQLHTLNLAQMAAMLPEHINPTTILAFALLFIGFGAEAFMFPFHPIAADAHGAAPSGVSVIISGVITKMGIYALIRLTFFLYQAMDSITIQLLFIIFGCLSMFVCVTMALAQHDFKRLLAYHSISQIGYVLMAIGIATTLGISGGLYHAMNHTLFKGLLFLCAGAVLFRTGTTDLDKLGGLAKKMPHTTILFLIGAFSISGIPPFNGFVSKWYIYQAAFSQAVTTGNVGYVFVTVLAVVVSVMTLASFVKVAQSVFFGQLPEKFKDVKDVPVTMLIPMWIMAGLCIITGLFPNLVTNYLVTPAVSAMYNVGNYVDSMMGPNYALESLGYTLPVGDASILGIVGAWNPLAWLLLLGIVICAIFLVAIMGGGAKGKTLVSAETGEIDPKYDTFFSGEKSEASMVGGSDLFWGFKHNWRHYLGFMQKGHSGIVNDYTLWGVIALSTVILYIFAVM